MSLQQHPAGALGNPLPCRAPFPALLQTGQQRLSGLAGGIPWIKWLHPHRPHCSCLFAAPRAAVLDVT